MLKCFECINKKSTGIFAAGVLFGTAGLKILTSKDAKKAYTYITAAVLRGKEWVMDIAANVQENAEDIYAEAQQMNEERAMQEMEFGADDVDFEIFEDEAPDAETSDVEESKEETE